jgi:hypothetical protein
VAASSGSEDEDHSPEAYNRSIYLMVGVPYLTLGVFGFLIYRGLKKNERFRNEPLAASRSGNVNGDSTP